MNNYLNEFVGLYQQDFQAQIPRFRQNKFVQIVLLRETKSHAIFTTEGRTLDVERLQAGITTATPIDRVVMYKRKQIAPERRTGKALMRDLDVGKAGETAAAKKEKGKSSKETSPKECEIMGNACGKCVDCILYGFAATKGTGSQRARVLTDSGFVVRSESQVMRDIKLNAIQDTVAGGVAGSAFASRENLLPQVFIPTVETLVDVTISEFLYVLGNILKTTRYGAESNREGFIRNHLLAIYLSDVELFSNLELTQHFYDVLTARNEQNQVSDYLTLTDFTEGWATVEKTVLAQAIGRKKKVENQAGLLEGVKVLYEDTAQLQSLLQNISQEVLRYVKETKSKDKAAADDGDNGE